MLRETKTTRHRCEFANSVDSKSKRRKRAQQHRLQERMLQVNKQGDWRDVVVRVVPKVHFPERRINRFFSKSIAEGIRCGPTKGATFEPNEDSQAKKSDQGCKETKKNGCVKMQKNFFNSLLTTAASDFKKNHNEVVGNHNKMKSVFFLRLILKNPLVITKKKVNQAVEKNRENIKMVDALRTTCKKLQNAFKIWPRLRRGRVFLFIN